MSYDFPTSPEEAQERADRISKAVAEADEQLERAKDIHDLVLRELYPVGTRVRVNTRRYSAIYQIEEYTSVLRDRVFIRNVATNNVICERFGNLEPAVLWYEVTESKI